MESVMTISDDGISDDLLDGRDYESVVMESVMTFLMAVAHIPSCFAASLSGRLKCCVRANTVFDQRLTSVWPVLAQCLTSV